MIHFILGGARSGKSRFAQQQATALEQKSSSQVIYVATATAFDDGMTTRIARHQADRPDHWQLAEVPLQLAEYVQQQESGILLIDCLTLWLNNQLYHYPDQDFEALFAELAESLEGSHCDILLVSNEVGLGVIPMGDISRQFVDQAGWLNQKMAQVADQVTLVSAGLPLSLKG